MARALEYKSNGENIDIMLICVLKVSKRSLMVISITRYSLRAIIAGHFFQMSNSLTLTATAAVPGTLLHNVATT